MGTRLRRDQAGVVALNLIIVIAFALYAVIQLSRTALAVKQIDNRVETIVTEVGPGSNVSRLDMVAILDTVGDRADQILAAAKPLSGQANEVLVAAQSIDQTVPQINSTAKAIGTTVNSINGRVGGILSTVNEIRGTPGTPDRPGTGTTSINMRIDNIIRNVNGIDTDLTGVENDTTSIDRHTYSINCGTIPGIGLLNGPPQAVCPPQF